MKDYASQQNLSDTCCSDDSELYGGRRSMECRNNSGSQKSSAISHKTLRTWQYVSRVNGQLGALTTFDRICSREVGAVSAQSLAPLARSLEQDDNFLV